MGKNLNDLIREEAMVNEGRYNLRQYAKVREQKILHNRICKHLVHIADTHNIPMGVLVYIAVGTNAHRIYVFENGYKAIHLKKAEDIINLCKMFGKRFGTEHCFNDKVVHACAKYYSVQGNNTEIWQNILNKTPKEDIVMVKVKRATDLLKKLCGDMCEYSTSGRIVSFK